MQQQPAGAREAGRETQQQPAPSYAALERAHAAARDCYTLLMLAAVQAATLISFIHGSAQPLSSLATLRRLPVPLFFGACLAWRLLAPRSWERWRSGTVVALRLTLAALLLQRAHQRVAAHAAHSGAGTSTQLASAVLVALGAPGLALVSFARCHRLVPQISLGFRLP